MAEIKTKNNAGAMRTSGWIYILFLIASFLWISIYPAVSTIVTNYSFSYGNLLDVTSYYFSNSVLMIVVEAVVSWVIFEALFFLYREILKYNIYSFVVPQEKLKAESRIFFVYRNIIYGIFVNLCFVAPYLYAWLPFISIVVSLAMVLLFALHINKTYAESIIGHFVFKSFVYPVFVFEILTLLWQLVEVLV